MTSTKLSIAIMAHPDRKPLVDRLRHQLGDPPVAWDLASCSRTKLPHELLSRRLVGAWEPVEE